MKRNLKITYRPFSKLRPYSRNPRTHSKKQISQIADSIREFGFINPILTDEDGRILAGHGRVEAAKKLGMVKVPTVCIRDMTEAQKKTYGITDNHLAENSSWDPEILALEFQDLTDLEINFDLTLTGFETAEIDLLLQGQEADEDEAADQVPEVDEKSPPVSRLGDLWHLGRHWLLCGDALKARSYEQLLDGKKAQMVFTDPPYNVPIDGNVCGLGGIHHEEFAMASGEMSEAEFTEFLETVCGNLASFSKNGSIHYICMDWRHLGELLAAGRVA